MTSLLTKIKTLDTKISTNTQNISNKQNLLIPGTNITIDINNIISSSGGGGGSDITSSTDLTCNTISTNSDIGILSSIGGFQHKRLNNNVIQLNSDIDSDNAGTLIMSYNRVGTTALNGISQIDFRINGTNKLSTTASGVKIGTGTATEELDVAGNILASGSITASSAIINGVNINTTLTDILCRLELLENP